ncbi:MAG TPA: glycosyltransferase family 2 protein [Gammaproteobacteria bacterium]
MTAGIVNFNAGPLLLRCVESLLREPEIASIVVVDNASTDDSLSRLERATAREPRVSVIRNEINRGFASGCNQILAAVRTEFALLVNPDCEVLPSAISVALSEMDASPSAAMVGGLLLNPDGSEQRGCRRTFPTPARAMKRIVFGRRRAHLGFDLAGSPLPDAPVTVDAVSGAFMLTRMSAVREVGMLDARYFMHCEDLDWCKRFSDAGWTVRFVPQAVAVHVQGTSSRKRPVRVLWYKHHSMMRYYRKFHCNGPLQRLMQLPLWLAVYGRALLLTPFVALGIVRP